MHGTVHEHLWYLGNIAFVTILTVVAYKICKIYEKKKKQKKEKEGEQENGFTFKN